LKPGGTTSPAERLASVLVPSDSLSVDRSGTLCIEDCRADELLKRFGSPLYVTSEATLRQNHGRMHRAFADCWPRPVTVFQSIKANNNPAVRAVLHDEGAGAECFGLGEIHAAFFGGASPDRAVVNGSCKTEDELLRAVELGLHINIDSEQEVDRLAAIAQRLGKTVQTSIRLKVVPAEFSHFASDYFGVDGNVAEFIGREKWGFSFEGARRLIARIERAPGLALMGFSAHMGRVSTEPTLFGMHAAEFGRTVVQLWQATGFMPQIIDLGGGWPRERDPESRTHGQNPHAIEEYGQAAVSALRQPLEEAGLLLPQLWVETGRYLVGNAVVLLGTIGDVKRDMGLTWVHVDFSTNNLMRVDTSGSAYHLFAAASMNRQCTQVAEIVGPTCTFSRFVSDWPMPEMQAGDPVALLDAGMYAETTANQFNAIPRPATVLVNGDRADVIKERETFEDVFAKVRMPDRLRSRSNTSDRLASAE
jgi:diaminopimelate decarboxylase